MRKRYLVIGIIVLTIFNLIFISSSQTISVPNEQKDKKLINEEKNNLEGDIKLQNISITCKKIDDLPIKNIQKENNTINKRKINQMTSLWIS